MSVPFVQQGIPRNFLLHKKTAPHIPMHRAVFFIILIFIILIFIILILFPLCFSSSVYSLQGLTRTIYIK